MATLLDAVSGDTFNGLNGYKRPLQSNPTRVPGNQPSFRGVPNQPGKDIRAPAIKSSANHPDRKTNVTIPYARVTPVETPADIGRLNEGDVAFCSKSRPALSNTKMEKALWRIPSPSWHSVLEIDRIGRSV